MKNVNELEFKEGVFTQIRAKSIEKSMDLVKRGVKTDTGKEVLEVLKDVKKFIDLYPPGSGNGGDVQAITVKICKGKFCVTFKFLKKVDLDITIEL